MDFAAGSMSYIFILHIIENKKKQMKKIKKHLIFKIIEYKPKKVYEVRSNYNGSDLGSIYWYRQWQQYIFEPNPLLTSAWNQDCLLEVVEFIQKLTKKKK